MATAISVGHNAESTFVLFTDLPGVLGEPAQIHDYCGWALYRDILLAHFDTMLWLKP